MANYFDNKFTYNEDFAYSDQFSEMIQKNNTLVAEDSIMKEILKCIKDLVDMECSAAYDRGQDHGVQMMKDIYAEINGNKGKKNNK